MCSILWYVCVVTVAGVAVGARAATGITVVQMELEFGKEHNFSLDNTVEYIFSFLPSNPTDALLPSRVWVHVDGGDVSRPVLITYRQRAGAGTWQLPYRSGERLLYEFERTLCPEDSADVNGTFCGDESQRREGEGEGEGLEVRGSLSLNVMSMCARGVRLRLRAAPARDWLLALDAPRDVAVTMAAPHAHLYRFGAGPDSVRLKVASEDDVCAIVGVQNYTCPIGQTMEDIGRASRRMTIQRSGAVQLKRSNYPLGFYVVVVVLDTDEQCTGEEPADEDWLWELLAHEEQPPAPAAPRDKTLTLLIQPALSRTQYVVATLVTLALFAAMYAACGALVLAQRWPRFARHVRPRAVLAARDEANGPQTAPDTAFSSSEGRRRRRGSDATFDSSDLSDSDDDEEAATRTTTALATPANSVSPASPASPNSASPTSPPFSNSASPASPTSPNSASAASPASPVSPSEPGPTTAPTTGTSPVAAASPETNSTVAFADGSNAPDGVRRDNEVQAVEEQTRPFGLPARLRVAALARRRGRVLRSRSDRYLYTLYTVAVFYLLPVVQFVVAFQIFMNAWGSLDLCYYNFLCAHPLGELSDFNHVYSNLGYLMLGALFLLQVRRRRAARRRRPRHEEYGIPAHYGLLQALGAGLMVVGLLSATYHVCPNQLNFQFDTAFMYVLAVLSMVKIYQARHPDVNARAHATFGVLAVIIALVVWGVLGGGALFWAIFTVIHVFAFLLLSLRIYYVGQFRFEKQSLQRAARELRALPAAGVRPLYSARLVLLVIANAANWALAIYGMYQQSADFAGHMLTLLLSNTLLHLVFYMVMKLLHGERPRWYHHPEGYVWCFLAGALATWSSGLYFFLSGSTDWAATPAQSRHLNHECRVLQFYDSHDLWHFLSALALYLTFNLFLTWDDGLAAVKRTEIAVF